MFFMARRYISILLDILLILELGSLGAAIVSAISVVLVNLLRLSQVYLIFRIHPFNKSYFKPIIAGVGSLGLSIGCGLFLNTFSSLSQIIILSIFYVFFYGLILKVIGVDPSDVLVFRLLMKRILGGRMVNTTDRQF